MSCLSWRGIFHESWKNKIEIRMGGLRETGGLPPFFSRKGALTHHPEGAVVLAVGKPCALRGGITAVATASRQCHSTCGGAAVIVCAGLSCFRFGNSLRPARTNLPPAALFAAMTRNSASGHFLFCERETEERKRGE